MTDCTSGYHQVGTVSARRTVTAVDTHDLTISDTQLNRILIVMGASWALSTKETYGAGLLVFQVYCDSHQIQENQRCPISSTLLAFLSSCTGAYSGSSLGNYATGLKAWHLLHGYPWLERTNELKAIPDGATALAPPPVIQESQTQSLHPCHSHQHARTA
jgi:hypothetical protein